MSRGAVGSLRAATVLEGVLFGSRAAALSPCRTLLINPCSPAPCEAVLPSVGAAMSLPSEINGQTPFRLRGTALGRPRDSAPGQKTTRGKRAWGLSLNIKSKKQKRILAVLKPGQINNLGVTAPAQGPPPTQSTATGTGRLPRCRRARRALGRLSSKLLAAPRAALAPEQGQPLAQQHPPRPRARGERTEGARPIPTPRAQRSY